ncbi:MAG: low molecular weight protein arginine phosphatase [Algisphaera sp.]
MNILLVCTGNTCRSPMAEVIACDLFKDQPGVVVGSAGVSAGLGGMATVEAVTAMAELGLDLKAHRSRPLTNAMVDEADHVLTMTQSHRAMVVGAIPSAESKTAVLDEDMDVQDPIGGTLEDYRATAEQIKTALMRRFSKGLL